MPAYKIPRYVVIRTIERSQWKPRKYPEKIYEGNRKDKALEASEDKYKMRYFIQELDHGSVHQMEITREELENA